MLETALREFTRGRTDWPRRRDFAAVQRLDLYFAAVDYGGIVFWAGRLRLGLSARQLAKTPYTDEEAVRDARTVIEAVGFLAGSRQLRRMGLGRLATAVQSAGGSREFGALHQLPGARAFSKRQGLV